MIHQGSQAVSPAQVEPSEVQALESLIEKLTEAIDGENGLMHQHIPEFMS